MQLTVDHLIKQLEAYKARFGGDSPVILTIERHIPDRRTVAGYRSEPRRYIAIAASNSQLRINASVAGPDIRAAE